MADTMPGDMCLTHGWLCADFYVSRDHDHIHRGGGMFPYLKVVGNFPSLTPFLTFSDPIGSFYGSIQSY